MWPSQAYWATLVTDLNLTYAGIPLNLDLIMSAQDNATKAEDLFSGPNSDMNNAVRDYINQVFPS